MLNINCAFQAIIEFVRLQKVEIEYCIKKKKNVLLLKK